VIVSQLDALQQQLQVSLSVTVAHHSQMYEVAIQVRRPSPLCSALVTTMTTPPWLGLCSGRWLVVVGGSERGRHQAGVRYEVMSL
jgi:hypothetical protein